MNDTTLPAPMRPSPRRGDADSDADKLPHQAWRWPTPPYASYPPSQEQHEPLACEIEGLNGRLMQGRLIFFVPDEEAAQVQVPPARTTMTLRFNQFRRLTLTEPLRALPDDATDAAGEVLSARPCTEARIHWAGPAGGGSLWETPTIGQVQSDFGLFLYPPADDEGSVRRVFVPASAYTKVELGRRIGDELIADDVVTPMQMEQAAEVQQRLRAQKLGDILVVRQIVTAEQLLEAISQQSSMPMVRLGEALIAMGLIDPAQLADALEQQKRNRTVPLGELLVNLGLVTREQLQVALARKMGYPLVDVGQFPIQPEALRKVPYMVAERLRAIPLMLRDTTLIVAVDNPGKRLTLSELEFVSQCKVVPVLAQYAQLERTIVEAYSRIGADTSQRSGGEADAVALEVEPGDSNRLLESLEREGQEAGGDDAPIEQSDNSLVRLINTMIIEAHNQRVSDIHIETYPGREKLKIRFRRDGMLRAYMELPHNYRSAVIARIKIMCDLDISERRKPQDGKINFARFSPGHRIELRVATIPTSNGLEDVVMRILASAKPIPLDDLGLSESNLSRLKTAMERPYGLVLCVGPTGSGKTTTLHSALSYINVPERKIWTAEDPVEITQPGLRQVQVNPKIDWTFAKALRAFLRADPDVIMVGEVRDTETAQMAIEASLTGHLVLSTLHTNSAPETVTRLLDMGMDPFNFADSLLVVLAQRLVRRLCDKCRQATPATDEQIEELLGDYLHAAPADLPEFDRATLRAGWLQRFGRDGRLMHFHSAGCEACSHTGFRGRAGLHELMSISRELRRLIQTGARAEQIQAQAMREGMRTLRQDGIDKVLQGLTNIEEVRATSNT